MSLFLWELSHKRFDWHAHAIHALHKNCILSYYYIITTLGSSSLTEFTYWELAAILIIKREISVKWQTAFRIEFREVELSKKVCLNTYL